VLPATLERYALKFPLLLRRPGFHTGRHFLRVNQETDLEPALQAIPGNHLIALQYLDTRSPDGKFRKYRVMLIDGACYPMHVAVSRDWKVHYFTADMAENAAYRREDEFFLNDMPGVLGEPGLEALQGVQTALGLDYAGIDFSLGRAGELIVFEANATMTILPPAPGAMWEYRRMPVTRVLDAVRAMLTGRVRPNA
jgi:hypothetical protein